MCGAGEWSSPTMMTSPKNTTVSDMAEVANTFFYCFELNDTPEANLQFCSCSCLQYSN